MCLSEDGRWLVEHHDDEIFPRRLHLTASALALSFIRAAQRELEPLLNLVSCEDVDIQGITGPLEYDRRSRLPLGTSADDWPGG